MTTDDVVERIRKLLRFAEDAGATEAEAASALERANALLIRHNLTMDAVAVSVSDKPAVTEDRIRTGWAGGWRGSLVGILARHNLCSPIISRLGRPANVQATLAMFDWISAQLERLAQEEWVAFDQVQRAAVAAHPDVPWYPECEDWTETYREHGKLHCEDCDGPMLPSRPLVRGSRGKPSSTGVRCCASRTACTSNAKSSSSRRPRPPTILLARPSRRWCCAPARRTLTTSPGALASCATRSPAAAAITPALTSVATSAATSLWPRCRD